MPGLMRGVARTAVDRRDGHRGLEQRVPPPGRPLGRAGAAAAPAAAAAAAAPPPPARRPPGATWTTKLAQLKELGELKEQGILTDAEFEHAEGPHPQRLRVTLRIHAPGGC